MICAKCKKEEESNNELLCTIKQTADNIIQIARQEEYYSDRLKIEKLIEDIYNKGFNEGYWQSIRDDYSI